MKQIVIDCIEAETKAMDLLKAEFETLKSLVCKLFNLEQGDPVKDKEDPKPIGPTVPLPPPPPPPPT
jgi:hypothetical protein